MPSTLNTFDFAPMSIVNSTEPSVNRPLASRVAAFGDQPLSPTPEGLLELAEESAKMETATPWQILQWAVDNYFPKLTMATAFGPEGCVIIHMLASIEPRVHLFNIDTGYQFKETL